MEPVQDTAISPPIQRVWLRVAMADGAERALELAAADTLVPPPHLTQIGRAPAMVMGLGNFHGTPRTVVDASALLDHGRTASLDDGSVLLVSLADGHRVGLGLPKVLGLLPPGSTPALPVPRLDMEARLRALEGLAQESHATPPQPDGAGHDRQN